MLALRKLSKNEAQLSLDVNGAEQLLLALRQLDDGAAAQAELEAELDTALLGARRPSTVRCTLRVEYAEEGDADGSLSRLSPAVVVWRLVRAEQEVQYAIERVSRALREGEFAPAEFLMVCVPGSGRELLRIFAEMVPAP